MIRTTEIDYLEAPLPPPYSPPKAPSFITNCQDYWRSGHFDLAELLGISYQG